ncbi:MAG: ribulose-phosphate 3-epimerase [Eubacteriales bacterium]|nr:ribulose-phosphate 3-epimerase [Eubacteriales bacterium]
MENILAPSILSADIMRLGEQVKEVSDAGAKYLHIDVMDGVFVPSLSYGVCVVESIRRSCDMVLDVHLMIVEPHRYVEAFAKAGADIITVHLEACVDARETIDLIHRYGCKAGLSIKPGTPVEAVEEYLDKIELLLIMSVEPGFGGQKYTPESTGRIAKAAEMIAQKGLCMDLEVDGGISAENAREVLQAGANVLVAGSSVFKDPGRNAAELMKILLEEQK